MFASRTPAGLHSKVGSRLVGSQLFSALSLPAHRGALRVQLGVPRQNRRRRRIIVVRPARSQVSNLRSQITLCVNLDAKSRQSKRWRIATAATAIRFAQSQTSDLITPIVFSTLMHYRSRSTLFPNCGYNISVKNCNACIAASEDGAIGNQKPPALANKTLYISSPLNPHHLEGGSASAAASFGSEGFREGSESVLGLGPSSPLLRVHLGGINPPGAAGEVPEGGLPGGGFGPGGAFGDGTPKSGSSKFGIVLFSAAYCIMWVA